MGDLKSATKVAQKFPSLTHRLDQQIMGKKKWWKENGEILLFYPVWLTKENGKEEGKLSVRPIFNFS